MKFLPTKGFLVGYAAGWVTVNLLAFYADDGFERAKELFQRANQGEQFLNLTHVIQYLYEGTGPYDPKTMKEARIEEMRVAGEARIARARAMSAEGFSHQEIADFIGIRENHVAGLLLPRPRYFKVTLSQEQHETIEFILASFAGSEAREHVPDNDRLGHGYERLDEALTAFRETTEEVE